MDLGSQRVHFNELDLPSTVYKYRRWDTKAHRTLITNAELMFDKPWNMGSDSELRYKLNILQGEPLLRYYEGAAKRDFPEVDISEQRRRAIFGFENSAYNDEGLVTSEIHELFGQYNDLFGAFCVGQTSNNKRLWEHFASSGYGFCVGLDPKKVINENEFWLGDMKYYDPGMEPLFTFPSINPKSYMREIEEICLSLPRQFSEEVEYRIYKVAPGTISVTSSAISEVIIGYNMTTVARNEIIETVSKSLPNAKLLESHFDTETSKIFVSEVTL